MKHKATMLFASMQQMVRTRPRTALLYGALAALALAPIVVMAVLLKRYSVNVPFWDQWEYVPLIQKAHHGLLGIHDLWMQHNEHRILFPRLVTIGLAFLTGYNIRFEVFANLITATMTFGLLTLLLRRTFRAWPKTLLVLAALTAWLLYSPVQWINWIWGFQLAFFMGVLFSVLTIYLLTQTESAHYSRYFYASLVAATVATYSLGNGIVVWGVGLLLLWLQQADRRKYVWWLATALVVAASYLYKFKRSPDSLPLGTVIREPLQVTKYVLSYLGRNLAITPSGARLTGAVLLVALMLSLVVIYRRKKLAGVLPWAALALYAICTAVLAAVSRLNFGINHSMVNSYTTISVMFIIGTLVLVAYAAQLLLHKVPAQRLPYCYATLVLAGLVLYPLTASYVSNYTAGMHQLEDLSRHMSHHVLPCVQTARSKSDACLQYVYPDAPTAWQDIQILRQLR
ncbi:MAG TPA: hypothetical protein VJP80_07460 [Candidatus Saccharimonadales bacterium]|nr:hypothetical protein [Candidatus Saccharimonadales bacterium]